ncbi:hypothetical protein ACFVZ3_42910, partial [Kitasatospora purpeofusca]
AVFCVGGAGRLDSAPAALGPPATRGGRGGGAARPPGSARAYNVGSGEVRTVGGMAAALAAAHGGPAPVVTGEYRLGDVRHVTADSARLRAELGWLPRVSFDRGMAEFAAAPLRV